MAGRSHPTQPSRLRFLETVTAAFHFLVAERGFRRGAASATAVEFISDAVVVNVFHDRPSYELGVEIGLRDDKSRLDRTIDSAQSFARVGRPTAEYEFTLDEVVKLLGDGSQDGGSFAPFAATREDIESQVPRLSDGLKRFAGHLLAGRRQDFEELARRRSESALVFTHDLDVRRVRKEAEQAWREKRFPVVVELLRQLGEQLTPAERKRLSYSTARAADGPTNPRITPTDN